MEWISVEDMLPNNGDHVLIYAGRYIQNFKYDVVRFEKGISIKERELMKAGDIPDELIETYGQGNYHKSKRSSLYGSYDEHGNNTKPYCWVNSPMTYFGQDVTHWMPLPEKPIIKF